MFNRKEYMRQWRIENKDKIREQHRRYPKEHPEKEKEKNKRYREKHKEKIKKYMKKYMKKYNAEHKEKIKNFIKLHPGYHTKYMKKMRKTNLKANLNDRMSRAIRRSLKGNKNGRKWESLVGYTLDGLFKRLKRTMPKGYCWDDYLSGKLEIDHIMPISAYNFTKSEHIDFRHCWALKNLRLLPAKENLIKSNKLIKPFQSSLQI